MSNVSNVRPIVSDIRTPEPMPETKTRRAIKADKCAIARLNRQIRAEEQRIALQRTKNDLEEKLRNLRSEPRHY